jgi:two-component system response regulator FlrC
MAHILVVDDEEGIRSFLAEALEDDGHAVTQAASGEEALGQVATRSFHVMLTDLSMPGMDGMALLKAVRREHADMEVIVLTAHGSIESAVEAMKEGAFDFLQKPVNSPAALRLLVNRAVERHRLRAVAEIATSESEPPLSYGAPAMAAIERALRKVAPTDATVLLTGDSGVGKEVAARAVHRWSNRAAGPFVAVNCAALAETLLESELFGHEKGAFTGAHARQRGRIELAEGGTFFLDEIGELKQGLQAKLLRVLQERTFERVGGRQTVPVNVRWVAATNRDLPAMVREGTFREDLYHRMAVFPVRLPPLRERREDIVPLAERLLARIGAGLGRPQMRLGEGAKSALCAADWPGNVRELANVLERSTILAEGDEIGPDDLALLPGFEAPTGSVTSTAASPEALPAGGSMAAIEREAIRHALSLHGGNRREAAAQLGIGLRTLYEKLKRYGLG